ncbi:HAD hydrolase-like protein [Arthrobacter alpinus]|uniref:HAD hydrolase-like protein n=1 Tax=Arthrobacter alpinus TaxID=656366 RepID=UPI0023B7DACC|nr:HAD hydrolase-like protein [Arthrobacter alpinus]
MTTASPTLAHDGLLRDAPEAGSPRSAVLFDLDGTLVDPAGGITGGIAHALSAMDLPVPEADVLAAMIGPKLADALISLVDVPADKVDEVIAVYRQWYAGQGMAMSQLYPGIKTLLAQLRASGVALAVATQKPEPLAKKLLAHHGIDEYFHVIRGSHADETLKPGDADYRPGKAEIIAAALRDVSLLSSDATQLPAVMVGDRHQDVNGARSNGLDCIGVAWGFAAEGELAAAGVSVVVHSTVELAAELAGLDGSETALDSGKGVRGAL